MQQTNNIAIAISTQTLLAVLFANNMTDVINLAMRIDNGVDELLHQQRPKRIVVQMEVDELKHLNMRLTDKGKSKSSYWAYLECDVTSYNPFVLKGQYQVVLPSGRSTWTDESGNTPSDVEFTPEYLATIGDNELMQVPETASKGYARKAEVKTAG